MHDHLTAGAPPSWAAEVLDALDGLDVAEPDRPTGLPPILTTGQRQGDVFVQPDPFVVTRRMGRRGVVLVDGQQVPVVRQGNGHVLIARTVQGGRVRVWLKGSPVPNVVMLLEVTAPAFCLLVQPSGDQPHLPVGIGAGQYAVCRQMEPVIWAPPTPRLTPTSETFAQRHARTFVVD
jgi:hypothetical protein